MNLLAEISPDRMGAMQWTHPPSSWQPLAGGGLRVHVPSRVDYFQDPSGRMSADTAPFLWLPVQGDFTAQAHVRHAFQSVYDAGAVMVRQDVTHWVKLCFEATDIGTHAVVSVVTNGKSDDANGANVAGSDIWLQVARQGDLIALHYAYDGKTWFMVRYLNLPLMDPVQVGLVAQCPVGNGAVIDWLSFSLNAQAPNDMRAGC